MFDRPGPLIDVHVFSITGDIIAFSGKNCNNQTTRIHRQDIE